MRLERAREQEDARQARRIQALLGFKEQWIDTTVAAQVIGTSGTETSRLLYLDKGAKDGIRADMPVITPDGVVGKVLTVYGETSQVLVINDPTSGVGATLVNSRLQGIVKGTSTGEVQLNYIMGDETVQPGEALVTSGGDRVFPKGLPIGTVSNVSHGAQPVSRYQGEAGGGFESSGRGAGHHRAEAARAGRDRTGADSRLRHSCRASARRARTAAAARPGARRKRQRSACRRRSLPRPSRCKPASSGKPSSSLRHSPRFLSRRSSRTRSLRTCSVCRRRTHEAQARRQ